MMILRYRHLAKLCRSVGVYVCRKAVENLGGRWAACAALPDRAAGDRSLGVLLACRAGWWLGVAGRGRMKFAQVLFAAGCAVLVGSGLAVDTDALTNEEKVRGRHGASSYGASSSLV